MTIIDIERNEAFRKVAAREQDVEPGFANLDPKILHECG